MVLPLVYFFHRMNLWKWKGIWHLRIICANHSEYIVLLSFVFLEIIKLSSLIHCCYVILIYYIYFLLADYTTYNYWDFLKSNEKVMDSMGWIRLGLIRINIFLILFLFRRLAIIWYESKNSWPNSTQSNFRNVLSIIIYFYTKDDKRNFYFYFHGLLFYYANNL